ncbi:hypothetical protein J6590_075136 [Homalodisca vitripennis]|nr:hypothetical protein J6590_075136 [Homalodisca vitripennis]
MSQNIGVIRLNFIKVDQFPWGLLFGMLALRLKAAHVTEAVLATLSSCYAGSYPVSCLMCGVSLSTRLADHSTEESVKVNLERLVTHLDYSCQRARMRLVVPCAWS